MSRNRSVSISEYSTHFSPSVRKSSVGALHSPRRGLIAGPASNQLHRTPVAVAVSATGERTICPVDAVSVPMSINNTNPFAIEQKESGGLESTSEEITQKFSSKKQRAHLQKRRKLQEKERRRTAKIILTQRTSARPKQQVVHKSVSVQTDPSITGLNRPPECVGDPGKPSKELYETALSPRTNKRQVCSVKEIGCSNKKFASIDNFFAQFMPDLYADDDDDDEYEVEELPNSVFKAEFHVPRVFYGGLIGQKGMTKRRIESESKTEITIPGFRATSDSLVVVKGRSRKDVCAGRRRIYLVTESLRKKTRPTHFTCVPVNNKEMRQTFARFKHYILTDNYYGIDELLFTTSEKLHVTFSTCTLLDDEERIKAAQILTDCREFVVDTLPIEVTVNGLGIMNDDPSSVSVLYACVDSPELQLIANRVLKKFIDAHLTNDDRDSVKLHMTIMKVRNRSRVDPNSASTFDARGILRNYADFMFGKFKVTEIHLSQMHTTGENGFYSATGIITV